MSAGIALNTDLPASWKIPGVYTQINFTGSGAALDDDSKRILIWGYRLSTGSAAPDTPIQVFSQSDCNAFFGRGSTVARAFAAEESQSGPGLGDIWCVGTNAPSSGTAATYTLTFAGPATTAGGLDMWVAGYRASIGISNGDTSTIVCTAMYNELITLLDLPCTFTDSGSGTLTITARHKGVLENDLPVMFNQTGATGITVSNGIVTYATNAVADGSTTVTVGATTFTAAITGGDTPTIVATAITAAINAGGGPVIALSLAGVVTLYPANMRPVRRVSAAIITSTAITATVTLHGTTGVGVPTLTTAIANVEAMAQGFSAYVFPWNDTSGTPSLTAMYNHVIFVENGLNQKGPVCFVGSAASLTGAGAVLTSPSPNLTASPRFCLEWCRETPQQAYEIAARMAAIYIFSDFWAHNFDGDVFKTRGAVPLLNPALADVPSKAVQNSAMKTYYMTPIIANSRAQLTVLRATTSSNASNQDLHELSTMRQVDRARPALNQRLVDLFTGKAYRRSTPKTPQTVTTGSVKDAVYVWCTEQDDQDLFDDAASVKDAIKVQVDAVVSTRFDVYVPFNLIRNLHQLGVSLSPQ